MRDTDARQAGSTQNINHIRKNSKSSPKEHVLAMKNKPDLEEDICIHIFTVSSAMVGVCLTVIGIIRVVIALGEIDTLADDLLAVDAFLFLVAALISYTALRTRTARRMQKVERLADAVFVAAMVLMTVICAVITFAISMAGK